MLQHQGISIRNCKLSDGNYLAFEQPNPQWILFITNPHVCPKGRCLIAHRMS